MTIESIRHLTPLIDEIPENFLNRVIKKINEVAESISSDESNKILKDLRDALTDPECVASALNQIGFSISLEYPCIELEEEVCNFLKNHDLRWYIDGIAFLCIYFTAYGTGKSSTDECNKDSSYPNDYWPTGAFYPDFADDPYAKECDKPVSYPDDYWPKIPRLISRIQRSK